MLIEILEYPLYIKLGYYAEERLLGQNALVSLWVDCAEANRAAEEDDLSLTVDYGQILALVDEVWSGKDAMLIETVVERLGQTILGRHPIVHAVKVKVEKAVVDKQIAKGARISVTKSFKRGE